MHKCSYGNMYENVMQAKDKIGIKVRFLCGSDGVDYFPDCMVIKFQVEILGTNLFSYVSSSSAFNLIYVSRFR